MRIHGVDRMFRTSQDQLLCCGDCCNVSGLLHGIELVSMEGSER